MPQLDVYSIVNLQQFVIPPVMSSFVGEVWPSQLYNFLYLKHNAFTLQGSERGIFVQISFQTVDTLTDSHLGQTVAVGVATMTQCSATSHLSPRVAKIAVHQVMLALALEVREAQRSHR